MVKAIAIIALALGLEAGFLLTAAIPAHAPMAPTQIVRTGTAPATVEVAKPAAVPASAVRVQARAPAPPPGRS